MYVAELGHPEFDRFDLSSLRKGVMSGAPCPVGTHEARGCDACIATASSSPMGRRKVACHYHDECRRPIRDPRGQRGTGAGEHRSADRRPGHRERLPLGEQGELCTRGYLVMQGYDDEPEATAQAIDSEGWLHTGDLALLRPDGYFSFRGRAKDTIIRGGENIYPREVEDFLHTHPKVADVYVVGIPDAKLGETVLAWIQLEAGEQATEEEIRDFCRGKVAYFKVPHYPLCGLFSANSDQEGAEVPHPRTGNSRARAGRTGAPDHGVIPDTVEVRAVYLPVPATCKSFAVFR